MVKIIRQYLIVILSTASLAFFLRLFVLEAYKVPTDFMAPALQNGDLIFVNKVSYGFRFPASGAATSKLSTPSRGDVVVFALYSDLTKDYVKRVVGLPGDTVEIKHSTLIVNGVPVVNKKDSNSLHEEISGHSYVVKWKAEEQMSPVKVPDGHLFVLGDDRTQGTDSRHWGFLPKSSLKGKAWLVWYAQDKSRMLMRVK